MPRLIAAVVLLSLLASCGGLRDSRLNPTNWFGRDREEVVAIADDSPVGDTRPLVAEIVKLKVDRFPGGALVHAIGLPDTQGYWEAELVPLNGEFPDKGVLVYEFRLVPPTTPQPAGTKRSREVVVGHFISDQTLVGVRRVQVIGLNNRRTVRR